MMERGNPCGDSGMAARIQGNLVDDEIPVH